MATDCITQTREEQDGPAIVKVEEDNFFVQEIDLQKNILQSPEVCHQCFRQLCYQEMSGPREVPSQLQALWQM
jgi:hypothetical protein